MRTKSLLPTLITSLSLFNAAFTQAGEDTRPLTLESIFASAEFKNRTLQNIQWDEDGSNFTFTEKNPHTELLDIHEYNIATGDTRLLVSGDDIKYEGKPVRMSRYQWTPDRDFLLITGPVTLTWDNFNEASNYVYVVASKKLWRLAADSADLRNVFLSPDGQRVAYVLENNLYVVDLKSGSTRAVTTDGSPDIFNGIFDYGSTEFGSNDAWFWSPDGKKIAFWRLDVTDVRVFYIIDELGRYSEVYPLKYPNTGERHAINQIGVFDIESGRTTWMDIGIDTDDYIPRINWASSSQTLAIQHLTRNHKELTPTRHGSILEMT
jgi:dipeptidyl-peptidase-4